MENHIHNWKWYQYQHSLVCDICGKTMNEDEIVRELQAAQQSVQLTGLCPDCHEPLVNGVCPALYALQDTPRN